MSPWRLELLRLLRTRRLVALVAMFVMLGVGGPVLVHYLPQLVKGSTTNGVKLILPKPKPADGIRNFANNISSLGTLVVVIVTSASISIDANPVIAIFYRARVRRPAALLLPRFVTVIAAGVLALALGTLGAWYETSVLIGPVPVGPLAVGFLLEALWLFFIGSAVTLFSTVIRGVLAVVGAAVTFFWPSLFSRACPVCCLGCRPVWHKALPTSLGSPPVISGTPWSSPRRQAS